MDVTPLIKQGQQIIQSYAGGIFKVSGVVYQGAIIVTPEKTYPWDAPEDLGAVKPEYFADIKDCDVILLGTGKVMRILSPAARKSLNLPIDAMATDAACRTYNVLMAEGRRVAAALLPYV